MTTYIDETHQFTPDDLGRAGLIERRSTPRTPAPTICPHCATPRMAAHHLRDAGELGPAAAEARGYCPVLARKRGGTE